MWCSWACWGQQDPTPSTHWPLWAEPQCQKAPCSWMPRHKLHTRMAQSPPITSRRRRVWGKRTILWGRKSHGVLSSSDACSEKTEDGERQARDDTSCHSLSCLLWIRSVISSPGGRFKRYCTASSRVRFWKLVSFTCRGKTLRRDPPVGQRDRVPAGSWGHQCPGQGGRGNWSLPQPLGDPGDSPSGWHLHPDGC